MSRWTEWTAAARTWLLGSAPPRVLVVSTPRAGNSWLRRMLATLYGLSPEAGTELWAHDDERFPWDRLPQSCVMQLHWHPEPRFLERLRAHDVRAVMIHRHPLDVLISILQLSRHTSEPGMWLLGEGGDESGIRGVRPRSAAFLDYATGPRASALLSVSREWMDVPGTLAVRYEDLVADPYARLGRLARALHRVPEAAVREAVDACSLDRLRQSINAIHFWQGKPGLWRRLLPAAEARRIAAAHPEVFRRFRYACDPDPALTGEAADAHWDALVEPAGARRGAA